MTANAVDWNAMDDERFRQEVRSFYRDNYPEHLRRLTRYLGYDQCVASHTRCWLRHDRWFERWAVGTCL